MLPGDQCPGIPGASENDCDPSRNGQPEAEDESPATKCESRRLGISVPREENELGNAITDLDKGQRFTDHM